MWYWEGAPLSDAGGVSGAQSAALNLNGVNPDQAGAYSVVVANGFGALTSAPPAAILTVLLPQTNTYDTPPAYLMPPYAYWNVADISDPAQPVNIGALQEPFTKPGYATPPPPLNTPWHESTRSPSADAYGTTCNGGEYGYGTVYSFNITNGAFTVLHAFAGAVNGDGAHPCAQLVVSGSPFYGIPATVCGTTSSGGAYGYGTVFKVNTDDSGFTNLYNFTGGSDGRNPQTGLLISGDTLYGATTNSIFKINTDGSDFTCLAHIDGASHLILSLSGAALYGTTLTGGANHDGSVFRINTDGSGFTNIYSFSGGDNGAHPTAGLELYGVGRALEYGPTNCVLFGTTSNGGAYGYGTVFRVNTDGSDFTNLFDFDWTNDGAYPLGGLLVTNNNTANKNIAGNSPTYLIGTTSAGGRNGGGTVFGMNLDGSGFTNLYSFGGANGAGANPEGKLAFVGNVLCGTTSAGGAHGQGMVFDLNPGNGGLTNLYDFSGGNDGASPLAGLAAAVADNPVSLWALDATINVPAGEATNLTYSLAIDNGDVLYVNGQFASWGYTNADASWPPYAPLPHLHPGENNLRVIIGGDDDENDYFAMTVKTPFTNVLYGTTSSGGSNSDGTVFTISPEGYKILYSFANQPDGQSPIGDLVLSSNTLYGVTKDGGTNSFGEIYRINTDGSGYTNLYSFSNQPDGANPDAGLVLSGNTLYGTTEYGGVSSNGAIFRINTDGSGYTNLYSFSGGNDGQNPEAPLVLTNGALYGTTFSGGSNNGQGTVFSIGTDGSGFQTLYTFTNTPDQNYDYGRNPHGGLVLAGNKLYGTTEKGGSNSFGIIFSIGTDGSGFTNLYTFKGYPYDGANPRAGLTLSGNRLYGTTYQGGTNNNGTIFRIGTNGSGYTNLLSFGSLDSNYGQNPRADLLILGDSLYGTTYNGGADFYGMVFGISTNGTGFNDVYDFMTYPDGAFPEGGPCSP